MTDEQTILREMVINGELTPQSANKIQLLLNDVQKPKSEWHSHLGVIMILIGLSFLPLCYFDLPILHPADIIGHEVGKLQCDTILKFYYIGLSVLYSSVLLLCGTLLSFKTVQSAFVRTIRGFGGVLKTVFSSIGEEDEEDE